MTLSKSEGHFYFFLLIRPSLQLLSSPPGKPHFLLSDYANLAQIRVYVACGFEKHYQHDQSQPMKPHSLILFSIESETFPKFYQKTLSNVSIRNRFTRSANAGLIHSREVDDKDFLMSFSRPLAMTIPAIRAMYQEKKLLDHSS